MTQHVPMEGHRMEGHRLEGHRLEASGLHTMVFAHMDSVSPWNMGTSMAKSEASIQVTVAFHNIHLTAAFHTVAPHHFHTVALHHIHTVGEWWKYVRLFSKAQYTTNTSESPVTAITFTTACVARKIFSVRINNFRNWPMKITRSTDVYVH